MLCLNWKTLPRRQYNEQNLETEEPQVWTALFNNFQQSTSSDDRSAILRTS